jgi:hypothetical protein
LDSETLAMREIRLKDFDGAVRRETLAELAAALHAGRIAADAETEAVNMHCHTFYSFNAYGHSPTSLAWLAKRRGYKVMGIVDFDVLDGVDEFLSACEILGVRGSAGLETRACLPEFSDREMNSPGEPGVYYAMGVGFTSSRPDDAAAEPLARMRRQAEDRNRAMLEKLNAHMAPVMIDYEADVQSLTPAGNATERHMLQAYIRAVRKECADPESFWAMKLNMPADAVRETISQEAGFQNLVRAKLMKRGGVAYTMPGPDTFPHIDAVHQLIAACGALPCATWLDGVSAGEQAIEELLGLLVAKGAAALNLIPDRNWNIAEESVRRTKVRHLHRVAELAKAMDLPLHVGTEMNSPGQKLVDDFDTTELAPLRGAFLDGAYFVHGHTRLQRALGLGYQSHWAQDFLPGRAARNDFYTCVGKALPPGREGEDSLRALPAGLSPAELLRRVAQRVGT